MLKTLYRTVACAIILTAHAAHAQSTQIKLLNPDGSPAADTQVVEIRAIGSRVDSTFKELPNLMQPMPALVPPPNAYSAGTIKSVTNKAGILLFDAKSLAVMAQNQSGFGFIPLPTANREVRLRPWAKLKIDSSAIASNIRESQQLYVLWENCFVGNLANPTIYTMDSADPFGSQPTVPQPDWRFDPFVMWSLRLDKIAKQPAMQEINIPPGEVTLLICDGDFETVSATTPMFPTIRFSAMRALSGKVVTVNIPEFRTLKGKLVGDANLPNWNDGTNLPNWNDGNDGTNRTRLVLTSTTPVNTEVEKLRAGINFNEGRPALDEFARRCASDWGCQYRYSIATESSAHVEDDGTFMIKCMPGRYAMTILDPSQHVTLKKQGDADDKLLIADLTAQTVVDVGEVERVSPPQKSAPANDPAFDPPKAELGDPEAAKQKIQSALNTQVEVDFQGISLLTAIDELSTQTSVPIRLNTIQLESQKVDQDAPVSIALPRMTLQSALRNILASISPELTFTIRDEILLITTKADATRDQPNENLLPPLADADSGDAFLNAWLKSRQATEPGQVDEPALRKALQAHLENEFDAKLQARQKELASLRDLLKQSEEWLSTRQNRRAEIVGKKVDELVKKARSAKP